MRQNLIPRLVLLAAFLSGPALAGSQIPPDVCTANKALYDRAKRLYDRKKLDEAIEAAARVQRSKDCEFVFIQAMGLLSRICVFEHKCDDPFLEATYQALEIDPRQSMLWFAQGHALYRLGRYREAYKAFLEALPRKPVPISETMLIEIRLFIAKSADSWALEELPSADETVQSELLMRAIHSWQEFQDFCRDVTCPAESVRQAAERIEHFESQRGGADSGPPR